MVMREQGGHPWMGNSLPALKQQMLDDIGVASIEQLFEQIPQDHRLRRRHQWRTGQRAAAHRAVLLHHGLGAVPDRDVLPGRDE